MLTKEDIAKDLKSLQDDICAKLEKADGKGSFKEDKWERPGGGGGRTRIFNSGEIIEKGGVNFSAVEGKMPENIQKALNLPKSDFFATGVSIVIHPYSPMVPIIHMNVRYFETQPEDKNEKSTWWFGGGIDLTPHYVNKKDAAYFHRQLKNVCDQHDQAYYKKFKKWADDYFFIKHRKETRGIGGIFFDKLSSHTDKTKEDHFEFIKTLGYQFAPIYTHLMNNNSALSYGENELKWQKLRRGRYVEFNLVWDKGTKFGLETDGRTESILMSLPPQANWVYDYHPKPNSKEEQTLQLLKKDIDWINIENT